MEEAPIPQGYMKVTAISMFWLAQQNRQNDTNLGYLL